MKKLVVVLAVVTSGFVVGQGATFDEDDLRINPYTADCDSNYIRNYLRDYEFIYGDTLPSFASIDEFVETHLSARFGLRLYNDYIYNFSDDPNTHLVLIIHPVDESMYIFANLCSLEKYYTEPDFIEKLLLELEIQNSH